MKDGREVLARLYFREWIGLIESLACSRGEEVRMCVSGT